MEGKKGHTKQQLAHQEGLAVLRKKGSKGITWAPTKVYL